MTGLRTLGPALALLLWLSVPAALAAPASPSPAAPPAPGAAAPVSDRCAACHLETGDERLEQPARMYASDIHRAKGFGCVACHGGDSEAEGPEAMDPKKGYIGKPGHQQIVSLCSRCHSDARFMKQYNPSLRVDQAAEYATSMHGRRLRERNDPKVATCTSCHPAHQIKPPSDPTSSVHPLHVARTCGTCHADPAYMAGRKIATDQLQEYMQSVHWRAMSVKGDLSAPTCNDCHGNHGAAPPGVQWVGNVCGQCHSVMAEFFAKSVHARVFASLGTPGCAGCHGNHAIKPVTPELVGLGEGAVCANCHKADDRGGQVAGQIKDVLDRLRGESQKAADILRTAEHAGMEVSQALFDLNGAKDALVKARAAVHTFTVEAVAREAEAGLGISARAYERGVRALKELQFRRAGLAVSIVIILALIGALVVKIRQVDRRTELGATRSGGRVDG